MAFWTSHQQDTRKPVYHIRVKGSLDLTWAEWFDGFEMTTRGDETLLSGTVADQAALHGVLGKINGLGLSLILVAQVDCPCPSHGCPKRGQCQACAACEAARNNLPFCFRSKNRWDQKCHALQSEP